MTAKKIKNIGAIGMMVSPLAFIAGMELGAAIFTGLFLFGLLFVIVGRMGE